MYLLLIVLIGGGRGDLGIIQQEHASFDACERARNFTVESIAKTNKGNTSYISVHSQGCFKK